MRKVNFNDFMIIMSYDVVKENSCIEISFCVDYEPKYNSCWMGKTIGENTKKPEYWFGLTEDGLEGYDYDTLDSFLSSKVFNGKSITDIWNLVTLLTIDGCGVEYRLDHYINNNNNNKS